MEVDVFGILSYIGILEGLANDMSEVIKKTRWPKSKIPLEASEIQTRLSGLSAFSTKFQEQLEGLVDLHSKKIAEADFLEEQVKERTIKLEESLKEILKIKESQDADYFLISLLLQPFIKNEVRSEKFRIDFDLEQFKKVQFRNKYAEIGGDICSAYQILIGGEWYCVLVNADTMGKSMQGAAGALVFCSVFRTIASQMDLLNEREAYPERWLYRSLRGLQSVFESFDYSMMVSFFMGLLHERTGVLYYVNVDHPNPILYRDSRAVFLSGNDRVKNDGFIDFRQIRVNMFGLRKNDVLFVGSDGKDDIVTREESGTRFFDQGHEAILRHVEEASGNGIRIRELIKTQGKLSDDYSLFRVEVLGSTLMDAYSSFPVKVTGRQNGIARRNFCSHYRKGEYQLAIEAAIEGMNLNPLDEEIIMAAAKAMKKSGDIPGATATYERLKLRYRVHSKNAEAEMLLT